MGDRHRQEFRRIYSALAKRSSLPSVCDPAPRHRTLHLLEPGVRAEHHAQHIAGMKRRGKGSDLLIIARFDQARAENHNEIESYCRWVVIMVIAARDDVDHALG